MQSISVLIIADYFELYMVLLFMILLSGGIFLSRVVISWSVYSNHKFGVGRLRKGPLREGGTCCE